MSFWTSFFEYHFTLEPKVIYTSQSTFEIENFEFLKVCQDVGGKSSVINNYNDKGEVVSQHQMFTYRTKEPRYSWEETRDWLKLKFADKGITFVRHKVECSAVGMPMLPELLPKGYYEMHFKADSQPAFSSVLAMSRAAFNPNKWYMTARCHAQFTPARFFGKIFDSVGASAKLKFPEIEFCVYDDNEALDDDWI
jgi:hypothetical protein